MLRYLVFLLCAGVQADVLDTVLAQYSRPFTLLSVGRDAGRSVANWAPVYPESVFVVLDDALENETALSAQANILWLNHRLLFQGARELASCEHVDVLLLCLQEFGEQWKEALQTFQQMTHLLIVELPKNQYETMHSDLSQIGKLHETASSVCYVLEGKEPFRLVKTTLIHPKKRRWAYEIHCDYNQKYLKKIRPNWTGVSNWMPGINMMTFLMLNGAIPSRSEMLAHLPLDPEHSDWVPNNMIVQGSNILLIDQADPVSTPITPDGGKRFRDMEAKMRALIATTADLPPSRVREAFISIYNWGDYFDQTEIEE